MRSFKLSREILTGVIWALFTVILFTSCKKNNAASSNSRLAISAFVPNAPAIDVLFDDARITTASLSYGSTADFSGNIYTSVPAGVHNLKISSGAQTLLNNNIQLEAGSSYSLFLYDSVKNNKIKAFLATDDVTTVDTVSHAKARFFNFLPGSDAVSTVLTGDSLQLVNSSGYIGNISDPLSGTGFNNILTPGNYRLNLVRNTDTIFRQPSFIVQPYKLYSIIVSGITNGTGVYKESVVVLQNN